MLRQVELVGLLADSDIPGIRQQDKQAIRDVLADLDALRARCAEMEGERDAADSKATDALAEAIRCAMEYEESESARAIVIAERDAAKAEADNLYKLFGKALQDLEAARAGEARAVEALGTLNHAAKVAISTNYGNSEDEDTPLTIRLLDGTCDATDELLTSAQPALAWLAQDRREAAAEALEKADRDIRQYATQHEYGTGQAWTVSDAAQYCFDMAAALRAGKVQDV